MSSSCTSSELVFRPCLLLTVIFPKIPTIGRGSPGSTTTTTKKIEPHTTETKKHDPCRPVPEFFPYSRPLLPCTWRNDSPPCRHRTRAVLQCSISSASIVEERVKVGTPPIAVSFNDTCLMRVVRERCSRAGRPVPRVVHYVHFSPSGKWMNEMWMAEWNDCLICSLVCY